MPRPTRIVDAHVHLWDPARPDWYPYLAGQADLGLGNVTGMLRRFDAATYQAEAAGWNVVKLVNVAAATAAHALDETLEMERRGEAEGQPAGIVGSLPPTDTETAAIELIDRQMASASRFRGIRPMGSFDDAVPPTAILRALQERGLVFELMTHPAKLQAAAAGLDGFGELSVVVEHTGWPESDSDEERALWKAGMDALAAVGDNVSCKLSGLAMPLGTMAPSAFAPWIHYAIEAFGVDRCFFASNFPVDGKDGGSLDELWSTYDELTSHLSDADRDKLFATNAERVYGI